MMMKRKNNPEYQRTIFISISIIALGITMTTVFDAIRPVGIVMIAIGGFFLIAGLKKKKDEEDKNK